MQGQVSVRINTDALFYPGVTNAPSVLHYNVRLERVEAAGPVFVKTIQVQSANAGADVLFTGLQPATYQASMVGQPSAPQLGRRHLKRRSHFKGRSAANLQIVR